MCFWLIVFVFVIFVYSEIEARTKYNFHEARYPELYKITDKNKPRYVR